MSQAILDAVARSKGMTMAEVIVAEYDLELIPEPVLIFCQSGDDRKMNADRMIIKQADIMPHGLYNNVQKLGANGEHLKEYLVWLKDRVRSLRSVKTTCPIFRWTCTAIGEAFNNDIAKVGEYARELVEIVAPHKLLIEGPIELASKEEQIRVWRS